MAEKTVHEVDWDYRDPGDFLSTVYDVQQKHTHGVMEKQEKRLKDIGATFYPVRSCLQLTHLILFAEPFMAHSLS